MTRKTGGEVARGSRRWALWVGCAAVAAFLVWGVLRVAGGGDESGAGEASETGDASGAGAPADAEDYPPAAPAAARLYPEILSVGSAVLHDGVWFALDYRDARIHRIGSDGTYLGSFGRRGEGPGELRSNIGPIAMHGDSIAVLDSWGVHLYQFDGTPVADWRVEDDHCFAPAIMDMASSPRGLLFVVHCSRRAAAEPRPRVVLAEGRGPARTLVTDTADVNEVRWDRGFARMAAHPRGFVFGYTGDECLGLFDFEGAPLERICHDWMDRVPFPEDEADAYMNDVGTARARSRGIRVYRPESYPPFGEFSVAGMKGSCIWQTSARNRGAVCGFSPADVVAGRSFCPFRRAPISASVGRPCWPRGTIWRGSGSSSTHSTWNGTLRSRSSRSPPGSETWRIGVRGRAPAFRGPSAHGPTGRAGDLSLQHPALRGPCEMNLPGPVTFFAGENGSGSRRCWKRLRSSRSCRPWGPRRRSGTTRCRGTPIRRALTAVWRGRTHRGFFLRAEDFFGFVQRLQRERAEMEARIEQVERDYVGRSELAKRLAMGPAAASLGAMEANYGKDLDANSHGESFLRLFRARFVPNGLYLLDEPEAALSPQSQLGLLAMMSEMVEQGGQFIIATHSPLLMAVPGATIYSFDDSPLREVAYDAVDGVVLFRDVLAAPERYMRRIWGVG